MSLQGQSSVLGVNCQGKEGLLICVGSSFIPHSLLLVFTILRFVISNFPQIGNVFKDNSAGNGRINKSTNLASLF